MKVVLFGANGDTGKEIMKALLARGHTVVAAVRRPETIEAKDGITIAKIDLNDTRSVTSAISGGDVVISALGSGALTQARQKTDLYSTATRTLRNAMREVGVKRIIVLSSGGVEEEAEAPWFYNNIIRRYIMNTYIDMAKMETILEESDDLEWTSVRITYLLKGPSKPYLAEDRTLGRGSFKIHYVDVAGFVAKEVDERKWLGKMPVLGYP